MAYTKTQRTTLTFRCDRCGYTESLDYSSDEPKVTSFVSVRLARVHGLIHTIPVGTAPISTYTDYNVCGKCAEWFQQLASYRYCNKVVK